MATRSDQAALRKPVIVALVGNGPSLTGRGLGPEIDEAGIVVRFNKGLDAGCPEDRGERTDILVVDGHPTFRNMTHPATRALVPRRWLKDWLTRMNGDTPAYGNYSTGMLAVLVCTTMGVCPMLYGFDLTREALPGKKEPSNHDYRPDRGMLDFLVDYGAVTQR